MPQHWRTVFNRLNTLNKKVILALDNPSFNFNPLTKCIPLQRVSLIKKSSECYAKLGTDTAVEYTVAKKILTEEALKFTNVIIVDVGNEVCPNGQCLLVHKNMPLYMDDNHLSDFGNELTWKIILEQI